MEPTPIPPNSLAAPVGGVWISILRALLGPILEPREARLSFGRAVGAAVLAVALWRWGHGLDIPEPMKETLWLAMGYNLGSKGLSALSALVTPKVRLT